MEAPRFYHPGKIESSVCLEHPAAHHALRVLRLRTGDAVTLFNGEGGEYHGVISHCGKDNVSVAIEEFRTVERESPLNIVLGQGISGAENMDFTVQKAVELGVSRIQPLTTRKSVVRLDAERAAKRIQHWQRVVIAACEQCGRNRIPVVERIADLANWLAGLSANATESRWLLSPEGGKSLRGLPKSERVLLLCGPEGGFVFDEEETAQNAGFAKIELGPRTLRTETAGLAAIAAIQTLWGDL